MPGPAVLTVHIEARPVWRRPRLLRFAVWARAAFSARRFFAWALEHCVSLHLKVGERPWTDESGWIRGELVRAADEVCP